MSFDTERLITEIEKRPCIWDMNSEEYSNRVLRQTAWNELADILYNPEQNIKPKKKVQELQKKWKGLRDYYNREKNKHSLKCGSPSRKKRRTPILDMLQFLSATDSGHRASSNFTDEDTDFKPFRSDRMDSDDSDSSSLVHPEPKARNVIPKRKSFHEVMITPTSAPKREDDPDFSFLMNILPEMKSMTPSQNFEFRFEVMKVIKNMKYNN